jgi:WD40 repeat protein
MKPYAGQRRFLTFAALALCITVCTCHEVAAQPGHTGMVMALAFSPDDQSLFVMHDHDVILKSVVGGRTLKIFRGHLSVVTSLAVSRDGKTLLTASEDGAIKLWSVEAGRVIRELSKGTPGDDSNFMAYVQSVAFSPDGRLAAAGRNAGDVTLWDVSTGRKLRTFRESPSASMDSVVFSPKMVFSPKGESLYTASLVGNVIRWDVRTGRKLLSFVDNPYTGISSMSLSADGRRILTVNGLKIRLWDAATGKELLAFSGMDKGYYMPKCVAFTPDGAHAISGDDSRVFVWDLKNGRALKTLEEPPFSHVESIAVSQGGEYVAAGDIFGNVRVWRYSTGESLWQEDRRGAEAEAE